MATSWLSWLPFNKKDEIYVPYIPYIERVDIERRLSDTKRVLEKYKNHIPVLVEKSPGMDIDLKQQKFLVNRSLTIGEFMITFRRHIRMNPNKTIYFLINNQLYPGSTSMGEIYNRNKSGMVICLCMYFTKIPLDN